MEKLFRQEGFLELSLPPSSVDIIVSFGDPFLYLLKIDEQCSAIKNMFKILKRGGFVHIDVINFFTIIRNYRQPKDKSWETESHRYKRSVRHNIYALQGIWEHKDHILVEEKSSGTIKRISSTHRLKMFSPSELKLLFQQVGFEEIVLYPGADLSAKDGSRI